MIMEICTEKALEARARRAAMRVGLYAKKSTWRRGSCDNYGQFMLIDALTNTTTAGLRFDLSPQDVIDHCAQLTSAQ
jgi:hypothetical protein